MSGEPYDPTKEAKTHQVQICVTNTDVYIRLLDIKESPWYRVPPEQPVGLDASKWTLADATSFLAGAVWRAAAAARGTT